MVSRQRLLLAALAAAGVVAGVVVGWSGLDTVNGCGLPANRYPSESARDWVENADVVVVGRAVRERESGREKLAVGPYRYDVRRTVTLARESVLFESRLRGHPAVGDLVDVAAPGWKEPRNGGALVPQVTGDAPRVEVGHVYVLALRRDGDAWRGIGEGGVVPFDGHVVGQGEWCGLTVTTDDFAEGERFGRREDDSLEKVTLGEGVRAVARELERAGRR
ncbi:hypothetical protein [Streptomyces griseosporeus]|uniref:hypothetical protein n=1 Tax=Streptomyces griseosporeus TaxID=1910 RepID=UPI0036FF45C1